MNKIKTMFKREETGKRRVYDVWDIDPIILHNAIATEKLDGTNVRVTVRNGKVVRLEKRRNPDKMQKMAGIVDPWYVDVVGIDGSDDIRPEDTHIVNALYGTQFDDVADGKWPGEAVGPKIQGNPLALPDNAIYLFALRFKRIPIHYDLPNDFTFAELRDWFPRASKLNPDRSIEGIVWHCQNGQMVKIKAKDFGR